MTAHGSIDAPRPRLRLVRSWDVKAFETPDRTPAQSSSAIFLWEDFPDVDGGVPENFALPLALALSTLGEVCFRSKDPVPADARPVGSAKARSSPFSRSWNLIGSRDPNTILTMFEAGWSYGDQMAVIASSDDDRVRRLLMTKRLDAFTLEAEELIVAAIVDGAGMLLAAGNSQRLEHAIDVVVTQGRKSGIPLSGD